MDGVLHSARSTTDRRMSARFPITPKLFKKNRTGDENDDRSRHLDPTRTQRNPPTTFPDSFSPPKSNSGGADEAALLKQLPWCLLQVAPQSHKPKNPNTSDYIIRNLLGEFKNVTKRKISDFLAHNIERDLRLHTLYENIKDVKFLNLINTIAAVSKQNICLPVILKGLLTWREFQYLHQTDVDRMLETTRAADRLKPVIRKRHQLCVDYTFLKVVLPVISSITDWSIGQSSSLEEAVGELVTLATEHFKHPSSAERTPLTNMFCELCYHLSSYNLKPLRERIAVEVSNYEKKGTKDRALLTGLLRGFRFLCVRLDKRGISEAILFLSDFHKYLQAKAFKEVRSTIVDTLTSILQLCAVENRRRETEGWVGALPDLSESEAERSTDSIPSHPPSPNSPSRKTWSPLPHPWPSSRGEVEAFPDEDLGNVDAPPVHSETKDEEKRPPSQTVMKRWTDLVNEIYESTGGSRQKKAQSSSVHLIPLWAALLCVSSQENFAFHFGHRLSSLLRQVKKDKIKPSVLFKAILAVTKTYILSCRGKAIDEEKLLEIKEALFHKRVNLHSEHLDHFAAVVTVIGVDRLEFTLKAFLPDLMSTIDPHEKIFIGMRALLGIVAVRENLREGASGNIFYERAEELDFRVVEELEVFPDSIVEMIIAQSDCAADPRLGPFLPQIETWYLRVFRLLEKFQVQMAGITLQLLRNALYSLPYFIPIDIAEGRECISTDLELFSPSELVALFARLLTSQDSGITQIASKGLEYLMTTRTLIRSVILVRLGEFALELSDKKNQHQALILRNLTTLLEKFILLSKDDLRRCSKSVTSSSRRSADLRRGSVGEEEKIKEDRGISESSGMLITNSDSFGLPEHVCCQLESIGLVFMCSPFSKIRMLALEILNAIRGASAELINETEGIDGEDLSNMRVMDIIDATTDHVLNRANDELSLERAILGGSNWYNAATTSTIPTPTSGFTTATATMARNKLMFMSTAPRSSNMSVNLDETTKEILQAPSLYAIAGGEEEDNHYMWAYSLGELVKGISELLPATVLVAANRIADRYKSIEPEEAQKAITDTHKYQLTWWKNYLIYLSSAASMVVRADSGELLTLKLTAEEIFSYLIDKLHKDFFREAASVALRSCSHSALESLFQMLQPIENDFTLKPKKMKKPFIVLRTEIEIIFAFIARHLKVETIEGSASLRSLLITHVMDTSHVLNREKDNSFALDGLNVLRQNFCIVLDFVSRLMYRTFGMYYETLKAVGGSSGRNVAALQPQTRPFKEESRNSGAKVGTAGAFFGFDNKQRKKLTTFLMSWCEIDGEQFRRALQAQLAKMSDTTKKQKYETQIKKEVPFLQEFASLGISSLLYGPLFLDNKDLKKECHLVKWIDQNLHAKPRLADLALRGLCGLMQGGCRHPLLVTELLNKCYKNDTVVSNAYFSALLEIYRCGESIDFEVKKARIRGSRLGLLIFLILFKCGVPLKVVRQQAIQLLQLVVCSARLGHNSLSLEAKSSSGKLPKIKSKRLSSVSTESSVPLGQKNDGKHLKVPKISPEARSPAIIVTDPSSSHKDKASNSKKVKLSVVGGGSPHFGKKITRNLTTNLESPRNRESEESNHAMSSPEKKRSHKRRERPLSSSGAEALPGFQRRSSTLDSPSSPSFYSDSSSSPRTVNDPDESHEGAGSDGRHLRKRGHRRGRHERRKSPKKQNLPLPEDEQNEPEKVVKDEKPQSFFTLPPPIQLPQEGEQPPDVPPHTDSIRDATSEQSSAESSLSSDPDSSSESEYEVGGSSNKSTSPSTPGQPSRSPSQLPKIPKSHALRTETPSPKSPSVKLRPSFAELALDSERRTLDLGEETNDEEYLAGSPSNYYVHVDPDSFSESPSTGKQKYSISPSRNQPSSPSEGTPTPYAHTGKQTRPPPDHLSLKSEGNVIQKENSTVSLWAESYDPPVFKTIISECYEEGQLTLSSLLASDFFVLSFDVCNEMVYRLDQKSRGSRNNRRMLLLIVPWVKNLSFCPTKNDDERPIKIKVLNNLLYTTTVFGEENPSLIELIWKTIGMKSENIEPIFDLLITLANHIRNEEIFLLIKSLALYLSRASPRVVVETLVLEVTNSRKGGVHKDVPAVIASEKATKMLGVPPLPSLFPNQVGFSQISRGHLALMMLSEIAFECFDELIKFMPIILQFSVLGLDNADYNVNSQCKELLYRLVHILATRKSGDHLDRQDGLFFEYTDAFNLLDELSSKEMLWRREDATMTHTELDSTKGLDRVVGLICRVLGETESLTHLRVEWSLEALLWVFNSPSIHRQCRSFQVFRALQCKSVMTPQHVLRILAFFRRIVPLTTPKTISLVFEALRTLRYLIEGMESENLLLHNQIFWGTVACLYTHNVVLFLEILQVLKIFFDRLDFQSSAVQNVYLASIPEWDPPFVGIQPLILRALMTSTTCDLGVQLLSSLSIIPCDRLIHPSPNRLLLSILSLLPYLCHTLEKLNQQKLNARTKPRSSSLTSITSMSSLAQSSLISFSSSVSSASTISSSFSSSSSSASVLGGPSEIFSDMVSFDEAMCDDDLDSSLHSGVAVEAVLVADYLARACAKHSPPCLALAEVFSKYGNMTSNTQLMEGLSCHLSGDLIFPSAVGFTFTFLFEMLENGAHHYRASVLHIIYHLMQHSDLHDASFSIHGRRWINIILNYLNGGLCDAALHLLEVVVRKLQITISHAETSTLIAFSNLEPPNAYFSNSSHHIGIQMMCMCLDNILQPNRGKAMTTSPSSSFLTLFGSSGGEGLENKGMLYATYVDMTEADDDIDDEFDQEEAVKFEEDTVESPTKVPQISPRKPKMTNKPRRQTTPSSSSSSSSQQQSSSSSHQSSSSRQTSSSSSSRSVKKSHHKDGGKKESEKKEDEEKLSVSQKAFGFAPPNSAPANHFEGFSDFNDLVAKAVGRGDESDESEDSSEESDYDVPLFEGDTTIGSLPFESELLSLLKEWQTVHGQIIESKNGDAEQTIRQFLFVSDLIKGYLSDYQDFHDALRDLVEDPDAEKVLESPVLYADMLDHSLFRATIQGDEDSKFSTAVAKLKGRDSSSHASFCEKLDDNIGEFNGLLQNYCEERSRLEDLKDQYEEDDEEDGAEELFATIVIELVNLHKTLLSLHRSNVNLQSLVSEILEMPEEERKGHLSKILSVLSEEFSLNEKVESKAKALRKEKEG